MLSPAVTYVCYMTHGIVHGGAPDGVEFVDEEEEYVVDEQGRGSWQPARPLAKPAPKAPRQKGQRKVRVQVQTPVPLCLTRQQLACSSSAAA
jgi:hypothetical protein